MALVLEVMSLSPALGVEVQGVDLSQPLGAGDAAQLRRLLDHHQLLVFRGQQLSMDEQVRAVATFGPVRTDASDSTGYVSNVRPGGVVPEGRLLFHSDYAFTPFPITALSLHAVDVPSDGCPTKFASGVHAAAGLPAELRATVQGRQALHVYGFADQCNDRRLREADLGPESPLGPRAWHPVLLAHPRTDAEVLYVGEMQTDRIDGLDPEVSERTLQALFARLYDPAAVYEHRWQPGDLVVWDNVAVQHARDGTPAGEARTLQRVAVASHSLFELVPGLGEALAAR